MPNPKNPERCFGKHDGYLYKCWQAHYEPDNNCDLIEKCYQEFFKRKEVKRSGSIFTVKEQRRIYQRKLLVYK